MQKKALNLIVAAERTLLRYHDPDHVNICAGEELDDLQRAGHGQHQFFQHCLQGR